MIVSPSSGDFGQASRRIARSSSNIPEARISARQPGIERGSISVIASVFTKCPNPVKPKTRASPKSASPLDIAAQGVGDNPGHDQ